MGEEGIFIMGGKKGLFSMGGRRGHIFHGWERGTYLAWVEEEGTFSWGIKGKLNESVVGICGHLWASLLNGGIKAVSHHGQMGASGTN